MKPKLEFTLALILGAFVAAGCDKKPAAPDAGQAVAGAEPTPALESAPTHGPSEGRIARFFRRRARKPAVADPVLVQPTPLPLPLHGQPQPQLTPQPLLEQAIFEDVAFKSEEEVLAVLGDPDYSWEGEGGAKTWYYSRQALTKKGKHVCPEVRFDDGEARVLLFCPPPVMKDKIAYARAHPDEGPSKSQGSFAFSDAFHSLGVGTDQDIVLRDLGEPDAKRVSGAHEEWDYETLVVENGVNRKLTVVFEQGKVSAVQGQ